MPSPIAHLYAGYYLYDISKSSFKSFSFGKKELTAMLFFSIMPDLDALCGIATGNMYACHNNISHSFFTGFTAALIVVGMLKVFFKIKDYKKWMGMFLGCYYLHIIMDFFTFGRGCMLFWPFISHRYKFPYPIFYGLQWSEKLASVKHLYTFFNELVFILVLYFLKRYYLDKKVFNRKIK